MLRLCDPYVGYCLGGVYKGPTGSEGDPFNDFAEHSALAQLAGYAAGMLLP